MRALSSVGGGGGGGVCGGGLTCKIMFFFRATQKPNSCFQLKASPTGFGVKGVRFRDHWFLAGNAGIYYMGIIGFKV